MWRDIVGSVISASREPPTNLPIGQPWQMVTIVILEVPVSTNAPCNPRLFYQPRLVLGVKK